MKTFKDHELGPIADLPCKFNYTNSVRDAYISELKGVQNINDLQQFCLKWKVLWILPVPRKVEITDAELAIVEGTLDIQEALDCIQQNKTSTCKHMQNHQDCPGVHISLPFPLLAAQIAAKKYKVDTDIALIQLCRAGEIYDIRTKSI